MKLFLRAITILALALSFGTTVSVQAQRGPQVFHRVQVRIYLPDGVTPPEIIHMQLDSQRSGAPLQTKNLIRETFGEFSQVPNGDYMLTVSADNENQIESYYESFSLRSNFAQVRQVNIFLRRRIGVVESRPPGTVAVPGTVDARTAEIPKEARKAFERGVEKANKGKVEEAIKAFEEALKRYPEYFEAINDLAVQYIKVGRYEEASFHLNHAMKLMPTSPLPHLNMGIVLNEQKRYSEAIDELCQAIHIDFSNPLAHFQLGFACFNTADFMRAQLEFEITVETAARKIPLARLYLADVYRRQARTGDAISQIEAFLRETPPDNPYTEVARKELAQLKQANQ